MILQRSPNGWSCVPTAFAMCLEHKVEHLLTWLDHDGSEIIWPYLPEPYCRRGFHIQEMILIAHVLGFTCTPFEALPLSCPVGAKKPYEVQMGETPNDRMIKLLTDNWGVLTGIGKSGKPHAVAWDGFKIHDPNYSIYDITSFTLETFWQIRKK